MKCNPLHVEHDQEHTFIPLSGLPRSSVSSVFTIGFSRIRMHLELREFHPRTSHAKTSRCDSILCPRISSAGRRIHPYHLQPPPHAHLLDPTPSVLASLRPGPVHLGPYNAQQSLPSPRPCTQMHRRSPRPCILCTRVPWHRVHARGLSDPERQR